MSEKDIQKNSNDILRYTKLVGENVSVKAFGQSIVSDRAYKKTERLALATHLITNHLDDSDNIVRELRGTSRSLLRVVARDTSLFNSVENLSTILTNVRLILSLIDLLFATHRVSIMNVRILKSAYIDFANFLTSSVDTSGATAVDLNQLFADTLPVNFAEQVANPEAAKEEQMEVKKPQQNQQKSATKIVKKEELKKEQKPTKNTSIKNKAISTNRRVVILDMIAKTGKITVKEVANQIPDTSPKTLQRELMSLVADGVLKKEGNKRWTTYTIV